MALLKVGVYWGQIGTNPNPWVSKLTMRDYILKTRKRFGVTKEKNSPSLEEFDLTSQTEEVADNIREYVGALQWAVTVARPDIARSVNALSRFTAQKCTVQRLKAAQKLMGYLLGTLDRGIVYCPRSEAMFESTYSIDGLEARSIPPKLNLF